MDVPELRFHVGKFLDVDGLRACALVCRAWHRDFQPLVWRSFSADLSETNSSCQIDSIRHNIHRIRDLQWIEYYNPRYTTSTLFNLLSTECYDSLVSLDLRFCAHLEWDQYLRLFENNEQTLQQVSITYEGERPVPSDRQFVEVLRDLSSLRRLTFTFVAPSFYNLIHLIRNMPKMVTLALVEHHHQSLERVDIGVMDGQESCIIELLSRCNQLQRLRFTVKKDAGVEVRYAIARPWVCTKLKQLAVKFVLGPDYNDSAAALSSASEEKAPLGFPGPVENGKAMTVLMTRLGQLSQIQKLYLFPNQFEPLRAAPLPWSLANGFSHLSCWTRLELLDFGRYQPFPFGIPELQFMRQHWAALKEISSGDIDSDEVDQWLEDHWPELVVARGTSQDSEDSESSGSS
ncbi:hypothetical protein DFQ26_000593, partial [Actinomortierella ambigua]